MNNVFKIILRNYIFFNTLSFLQYLRAPKQNVHKASFIFSYFFLIFKHLQPYPPMHRFKTNGSKGGLTQFLRSECDKMGRECDKMG